MSSRSVMAATKPCGRAANVRIIGMRIESQDDCDDDRVRIVMIMESRLSQCKLKARKMVMMLERRA